MSIAKHTAYNLAGTLVPLAISLLTIPLYLGLVGPERFGVLSICWLLLGYLGIFDLGLGRAVSQRIAVLKTAAGEERSAVFWAGFLLSLGLAAAATLMMALIAEPTLRLMRFEDVAVLKEIPAATPWLVATLPIALLSGIFSGALAGREQFGLLNVVEIASGSLTLIAPLAVAWLIGPDLWLLVAATLAARLVGALLLLVGCRNGVPLHRPKLPDKSLVAGLIVFGGWVTVTSLVGPLLSYFDRLAVGWLINAAAVSVYVIPFMLVSRLVTIPGALARAMFPRFASASGEDNQRLQASGLAVLSVLMTPGALILMLLAQPFLQLWVGAEVGGDSARVAILLLPGMWMNGVAQVAYNLLHAQGHPDRVAKLHVAEVVPYVVLLYFGLTLFGLEGAAVAWSLRSTADAVLLFLMSDPKLQALRPLLPPWGIVVAATAFGVAGPEGVLGYAGLGLLLALGTLLAYRSAPDNIIAAAVQAFRSRFIRPDQLDPR